MWTECHVIDFHEYFKNLNQKLDDIEKVPRRDWWPAEVRPEQTLSDPFPWQLHDDKLFIFYKWIIKLKIKSVAYSSQGSQTGQLDSCNWLADGSTTG